MKTVVLCSKPMVLKNGNGLWICEESEVAEIKADEDLTTKFLVLYGLGFGRADVDESIGALRTAYSANEQALSDQIGLAHQQTEQEKAEMKAYSLVANPFSGKVHVLNDNDPTAAQILDLLNKGTVSCADIWQGDQTLLTICCAKARENKGEEGVRVVNALIEKAGELSEEEWQTSSDVLLAQKDKRLRFINHVTREGDSALHRAVHTKNTSVVKALVEAGADIGLRADSSHTPYTWAFLYGVHVESDEKEAYHELYEFLRDQFADWADVEQTIKDSVRCRSSSPIRQMVSTLTGKIGWSADRSLDKLQLSNQLGPLTGMRREFEEQLAVRLMLVVEQLCLPLLALAGEKQLVDSADGLQLKHFCRDLLGTGVLTADKLLDRLNTTPQWQDGSTATVKDRALQVVQEGMAKLEAELLSFYEAAKPELAHLPHITSAEELVGEASAWSSGGGGGGCQSSVSMMHQLYAHGREEVRWIEELDDEASIRALLRAGMSVREVVLATSHLETLFGAADARTFRGFWTSVYAW
jgi:hypothetical protein